MISKAFIKKLKSEIEKAGSGRAKIIRETNGLLREAKHAGFQIHRCAIKEAELSLSSIEKRLKELVQEAEKRGLRDEPTLKSAIEEFLESIFFLRVAQEKTLPPKLSFKVKADEQLGALSDLTGELVRAATLEATKGNFSSIKKYRNATEELFGVLLQMDLRGILRQKRDDARRNLKRLEDILYDVSLKR